MPCRAGLHLETALKNRLNKGLFDSAFKNHTFFTLFLSLIRVIIILFFSRIQSY